MIETLWQEHAMAVLEPGLDAPRRAAFVHAAVDLCHQYGARVLVNGDVAVLDEDNGVGAFADTKDALGKPGKFSGVQFAPKFRILRVGKKVSHFHELSSVLVEDCIEEVSGE